MHPLLNSLLSDTWAMEPQALERFLDGLAASDWSSAMRLDVQNVEAEPYSMVGSVAVVPVRGPLVRSVPPILRAFGIDATGYDEIAAAIHKANADHAVSSIRLSIDSPGGTVNGVHAVSDIVNASEKPVAAHVDGLAASAAYWIGSQADSITAGRGAQIGSIGVYAVVRDMSRAAENAGVKIHVISSGEHKGAGVPGAPVTDAQLAEMKRGVAATAAEFVADVARGRGKNPTDISALADGRVWSAADALKHGLIDSITAPQDFANMDALALIEKHPARAAMIAKLARGGSDAAAIESAIVQADAADALAAAIAKANESETARVASDAKAVELAAKLATAEAALTEAKTQLGKLAPLIKSGTAAAEVKPDGNDPPKPESMTQDEAVKKYGAKGTAAKVSTGTLTLI